jgi:hypothetical protein
MSVIRIELSPQVRNDQLTVERRGCNILLNGDVVDLSLYDASKKPNHWIIGQPEVMTDGWSIKLLFPIGTPAPKESRFPAPILVEEDGPVKLPPRNGEDEEKAEITRRISQILNTRKGVNTIERDGLLHLPARLKLGELQEDAYFSEIPSPGSQYPEFAEIVAHVISTVSYLEMAMLRPVICQHGTEALLAVRTSFSIIKGKDDRKRYMRLLAQSTGQTRVHETISWATRYVDPLFKIRNSFAHNVWGFCPLVRDSLLLADPMVLWTGQAAHSQLMAFGKSDTEAQTLAKIAWGEGASGLSLEEQAALHDLVVSRQNHPSRKEAFDMTFNNPRGIQSSEIEVWTVHDFRNAALAANLAYARVTPFLSELTQWLEGWIEFDELSPLPT